MRTSARTSTSSPSQSPLPAVAPAAASTDEQPAEKRRAQRAQAGVISAFSLACLCAGGACCMALGHVAPWGLPLSAAIAAAVVLAITLTGTALALALRGQRLHVQRLHQTTRAEQIQHELDTLNLTAKEMPIARLILQHRSYQEIADQCHLSQRTVQFHASNIFRKAYVSRRRDFERVMLAEPPAYGNEGDADTRRGSALAQPDNALAWQSDATTRPSSANARASEADFLHMNNADLARADGTATRANDAAFAHIGDANFAHMDGVTFPAFAYADRRTAIASTRPTFPNAAQLDIAASPQQSRDTIPMPQSTRARRANTVLVEEQWFSTCLAKTPTTARSRFALQQKSSCAHRQEECPADPQ